MDLAISWRMKRPAYAPISASLSPSRSRCKTHCPSWNATGRRKTFPYAYPDSRVRRSLLRGRRRGERSFWITLTHDFSSRNSLPRRSLGEGGCSLNTRLSGRARVDDIKGHPQGEIRGLTKLVKITEEVRKYAAEQGITEDATLEEGLKEKSAEFVEKGAEVYAKA